MPLFDRGSWLDHSSPDSEASRIVNTLGIADATSNAPFRGSLESLTGLTLSELPSDLQIGCYRHGDYAGPHIDWFEMAPTSHGLLRIVVSVCTDAVEQQWLIHEAGGDLNALVDVARPASINVLRVPVWHQVTPLIATKGRETDAWRWTFSRDYEIVDGPLPKPDEWAWRLGFGTALGWGGGQLRLAAPNSELETPVVAELVPLLDLFSEPRTVTSGVGLFLERYGEDGLTDDIKEAVWSFVRTLQDKHILVPSGSSI